MAKVINGYEFISEDWKNNSSSKTAIARKGGKKYFLKRYANPVAPIDNGSLTPKAFQKNLERFNRFYEIRSGVNREIRKFAASGGDIIIPIDEFKDENAYVEASEFIDNMVPDDEVEGIIKSLPQSVKMNLLLTATGALKTVHAHNIVHSDLKLKNILLVKNAMGSYSAKLIDFDNSYFVGKLPDELVGDINYYSPELGFFGCLDDADDDYEEKRAEAGVKLTTKSDIFSLGLIFHYYLTGESVTYKDLCPFDQNLLDHGKAVYPWAAKYNGGKLVKSSKLTDPFLRTLIGQMTNLKPEERPDAGQVFMALKMHKLPPYPDDDEAPIIDDSPKVNSVSISPNSLSLSKGSNRVISASVNVVNGAATTVTWMSSNPGVASVSPSGQVTAVNVGSAIITATSTFDPTKKATCSVSVSEAIPEGFDEPWPGDNIEFNLEVLRSRGFVACKKDSRGGVSGYSFYMADPNQPPRFFKADTLVSLKYAKKKEAAREPEPETPKPEGYCEPWPEHGIKWNIETLQAKGWVAIGRDETTGQYIFVGVNGVPRKMNLSTILGLKLATRI